MSKLFGKDAMVLAVSLLIVGSLFLAPSPRAASSAAAAETTAYKWNVADKDQPLLALGQNLLRAGFAQSLTYPVQGACRT